MVMDTRKREKKRIKDLVMKWEGVSDRRREKMLKDISVLGKRGGRGRDRWKRQS